jgi:hypothetical protein
MRRTLDLVSVDRQQIDGSGRDAEDVHPSRTRG